MMLIVDYSHCPPSPAVLQCERTHWRRVSGPWRAEVLCGVLDPLGADVHLFRLPHFILGQPPQM